MKINKNPKPIGPPNQREKLGSEFPLSYLELVFLAIAAICLAILIF